MIMMMMMSQKTTFVTCTGRGPNLRFRRRPISWTIGAISTDNFDMEIQMVL